MAHNHPLVKGVTLPQKIVVFHAAPPVQLLHPLQGRDAPVDKDQMLRLQDGGHSLQPGPLLREGGPQVPPEAGQIVPLLKAPLPGQLADGGLRVPGEVGGKKAAVQLAGFKKAQHQPVAVAADGVDGVGPGQGHQVAQQRQAVLSLLQKVPQQDQNVVGGEPDLLHQRQKKGEVAVNITDGDDPPPRLEHGADYNCFVHNRASSQRVSG